MFFGTRLLAQASEQEVLPERVTQCFAYFCESKPTEDRNVTPSVFTFPKAQLRTCYILIYTSELMRTRGLICSITDFPE